MSISTEFNVDFSCDVVCGDYFQESSLIQLVLSCYVVLNLLPIVIKNWGLDCKE